MAQALAEAIELTPVLEPEAEPSRARTAVLKRLADVVCLPSSRVNAFERSMTADLLVEVLRGAAPTERARVGRRLAGLTEIPNPLCRLMLRDSIEIAGELLANSPHLREDDLLDCIRTATSEHRRMIASRRGLSEVISDALVEHAELAVAEALMRNDSAQLGQTGLETLVAMSQSHPSITALLLRRPELRPAQAYIIFWWADEEMRRLILQRFACSREVLQDAVSDIFAIAAQEGWQDGPARKALQFIERRQRNRAAIDKSPFKSLEAAVTAGAAGLTREIADEVSYLSGIKPTTGAKIFSDQGGEPIAIICKATGLPRGAVVALWRGLKRPEAKEDGTLHPRLRRVLTTYDMLAVDRAQTVLRYWNWALTSALTPAVLQAIRDGDEAALDEYSTPQKAAMLAFAQDMAR